MTTRFSFDIVLLDNFFLKKGESMMFAYKKKTIISQFFFPINISNVILDFPVEIFLLNISNIFIFNNYLNFRNNG